MSQVYSMRPIANGREASTRRTVVLDQSFTMRPLIRGESVGEDGGIRLFQAVYRGDYIITTTKDERYPFPHVSVSRHNEDNVIGGIFATEILNRIDPLLARYLLDYKLERKTNSM